MSLQQKPYLTHEDARRMAATFEEHDERLLTESYDLRDDRDAYIGFVRRSTEMLDKVMQADREEAEARKADGKQDKAAE